MNDMLGEGPLQSKTENKDLVFYSKISTSLEP